MDVLVFSVSLVLEFSAVKYFWKILTIRTDLKITFSHSCTRCQNQFFVHGFSRFFFYVGGLFFEKMVAALF